MVRVRLLSRFRDDALSSLLQPGHLLGQPARAVRVGDGEQAIDPGEQGRVHRAFGAEVLDPSFTFGPLFVNLALLHSNERALVDAVGSERVHQLLGKHFDEQGLILTWGAPRCPSRRTATNANLVSGCSLEQSELGVPRARPISSS